MLIDNHPLLDIDAMVNVSDVSSSKSNKKVNMKPNGVFSHNNDLKKAELHYNLQALQTVEHDVHYTG
jgi:hypothetical protein